ncbi:MAG: hypothetical protein AAGB19_05910 [Cyanobacteria bacterium P01_F01_bin.3]
MATDKLPIGRPAVDKIAADELPLIELFTRLRQAGLPLGMNEYQLVLEALESGFGLPDEAALARLCRTLWAKSKEDQLLFNYHFEQVMAAEHEKFAPSEAWLYEEDALNNSALGALPGQLLTHWRKVSWQARLALGSVACFAAGVALLSARPKCPYFTTSPPGTVELGAAYRYVARACKANPDDEIEITVLSMHPWLDVKSMGDDAVVISAPKENIGGDTYEQARLWNVQGEEIANFNNQADILAFRFSPDGQWILTYSEGTTVSLWDSKGNKINDFESIWTIAASLFSPDSQYLLAYPEVGKAQLFNLQGQEITDFDGLSNIKDVGFSDDGQYVYVVTGEGSAHLWDTQGNKILSLNNRGIVDAEILPLQEQIVTFSTNGSVQFWSWAGELVSELASNEYAHDIQLTPDGRYLLINSSLVAARLWDLQENAFVDSFERLRLSREVSFSPSGKYFFWFEQVEAGEVVPGTGISDQAIYAPWSYNIARIGDLDGNLVTDFNNQDVDDLDFSKNEQLVATRSSAGKVDLWNLSGDSAGNSAGDHVSGFKTLENIDSIEFLPEDRLITVDETEVTVRDFDGKLIDWVNLPPGIQDFETSPDSQLFATLRRTREVQLRVVDKNNLNRKDAQTFELVREDSIDDLQKQLIQGLIIIGILSGALITLILPIGYVVVRWLTGLRAKSPTFPSLPEQQDLPTQTAAAELNQRIDDEVQVAQAIHQTRRLSGNSDRELAASSFSRTSEYFPMTSRQMKQSWRYLRRLVREGPPVELDLEATVHQISSEGMLLQPVLRARRINRNELLLLIDQEGSMVPFHGLSERLAKTAISGGRLAGTGIYYFHNCPDDYLYHDPYHQQVIPISSVLAELHSEYTGVLIFSDAGAARGALNQARLEMTIEFLSQLRQQLRYVAWLNPMPRDRWNSTAGEIANHVPMFELSRQGLNQAIDVLRGKSTGAAVS